MHVPCHIWHGLSSDAGLMLVQSRSAYPKLDTSVDVPHCDQQDCNEEARKHWFGLFLARIGRLLTIYMTCTHVHTLLCNCNMARSSRNKYIVRDKVCIGNCNASL